MGVLAVWLLRVRVQDHETVLNVSLQKLLILDPLGRNLVVQAFLGAVELVFLFD